MLFHNWKQKTFIAVILICFCYLPPFSVFHSLTVLIPHKLFEACSPKSLERFNVFFFTFKIESILRIELKTKLFKFYAIQYDHTGLLRCVFFSLQSSTSFRTSKTERKCGELSARNLTDAVYCSLNRKRFVSTTEH